MESNTIELFKHAPFNVYWLDQNNCYLNANVHYINFLGLKDTEELIGKNYIGFFVSNNIKIEDTIVSVASRANSFERNYNFPQKEKRYFIVYRSLCDFNKHGTNSQQFMITEYEITPYKETEEKLKAKINVALHQKDTAEIYLQNLVQNLPGSIYWKDKNGIILGDNVFHARLAGFNSREEVIGKTDYDFVWKNQVKAIIENDRQVMETGQTISFEEKAVLSDRKMHTFLTSKAPLRDRHDEVIGVVGVSMDITNEKEAQEALKKSNHRARLEFVSTASHEIRNPISSVLSYAEFLKKNLKMLEDALHECHTKKIDLNEVQLILHLIHESSEYCQIMYTEAEYATIALKNLGDLHLMQLNGVSICLETTNIHNLLDIAIRKSTFPNARHVQIEKWIHPQIPENIVIDFKNITVALGIVIGNAFRFSHPQGKVSIEVEKAQDNRKKQLVISVQDFGVGMHENQIRNLLNTPSDHINKEEIVYSKPSVQLSRVKMYMEASGGSLDIRSTLDQGTIVQLTVTYELPLSKVEQSGMLIGIDMTEEPAKKPTLHSPHVSIATVLLIEDELMIQKITSLHLVNLGCQVDIAKDGADAIKMATKKDYDIVILDITLPDINGLEVMRQVQAMKKEKIIFIALSSHASAADEEYFITQGAMMLLAKPVNSKSLRDAIYKALETRKELGLEHE